MRKVNWNKKIAAKRGDKWKKALVEGKMLAKLNPTKLQKVRAKKQVPQVVVAKAMNMSLATYGAIERAKRPVKGAVAKKISTFFGQNPQTLFKKNGSKEKLVAKE